MVIVIRTSRTVAVEMVIGARLCIMVAYSDGYTSTKGMPVVRPYGNGPRAFMDEDYKMAAGGHFVERLCYVKRGTERGVPRAG